MTVEVRGAATFRDSVARVLASGREELLIGLANASLCPTWLLVVEQSRLAEDHEVRRDYRGLHWTGELTSAMYLAAKKSGQGLVLVHAHGGRARPPKLSETDQGTLEEMLAHFGTLLPAVPHAYVVINQTHATGLVQLAGDRRALNMIRVVSTPIRYWPSTVSAEGTLLARDDRQVGALGERGVNALRHSTIGIVGLGGAGSQVAEMLAHAGVGGLVLADADKIEEVNLSRTHGTDPTSVGIAKVTCAERLVKRISPDTGVSAIEESFPSKRLTGALRDVALIVACVDNPHTRNELNRFALRFAIPLLDLGTTITAEPFAVDGHLSLAMPDGHCLRCAGHVSDALLAEVDEAARRGRYGTDEGRPQVVSFNGLLASAAVSEALKVVTGFAGDEDGSREWHYDALTGQLQRVGFGPRRCRECSSYGMKGDNL
jgi:hypothetical protein